MSEADSLIVSMNIPAYWALQPYSWTSYYGGQTQANVMNMDIPPFMAYMAQNSLNPFFWAG